MAAALVAPLLADPRGCGDPTGRAGGGALDGTWSPGEGRLRGAAPSRYLLVPAQCGRLPAGMPRGMTPLRGERARTPRRPLRAAPRRSAEPRGGIGGEPGGMGLSAAGGCHQTGRASPWQSAPRLHRSAPTSRREEERGENCCISGGGTSLPGQAQPPALPPRPTHARRVPPAAPQPETTPPPAPHPLRCPLCPALPRTCPAPVPHPPAGPRPPAPSPRRNKRAPLKRLTGGFRQVLNWIFLLVPPYFSFFCPPKHAAPSEAGGGLSSGPCPGDTALRGQPLTGSEGSALCNDSWHP